MKLEDIHSAWAKDCKITEDLDLEARKIPELHSKYLKIYSMVKGQYHIKKKELDLLKKLKISYYDGSMTQEELKTLGWEPCQRLYKTDKKLEDVVETDSDVVHAKLRLAVVSDKCAIVENIIKSINNRGFYVKSAVDYIRFRQGS